MKKTISLMMVLLLSLTMMTACGGEEKTADAQPEQTVETTAPEKPSAEKAKKEKKAKKAKKKKAEQEETQKETAAVQETKEKKTVSAKKEPAKKVNKQEKKPQKKETEKKKPTQSQKSIAQSYVGKDVGSLIAAIGGPKSRSYAPSCLGEGQDGELRYSGFTVYTYKENGKETVQHVE